LVGNGNIELLILVRLVSLKQLSFGLLLSCLLSGLLGLLSSLLSLICVFLGLACTLLGLVCALLNLL
jgi:hypothetical protein